MTVLETSATSDGRTSRSERTLACILTLKENAVVLDPGLFSRNIVVSRKGSGMRDSGGEFEELDICHEGEAITISGTWARLGAPQFSWQAVEKRTVITIDARPRREEDETSLELYFRIRDILLGSFSEKVQGEFAEGPARRREKADDYLD